MRPISRDHRRIVPAAGMLVAVVMAVGVAGASADPLALPDAAIARYREALVNDIDRTVRGADRLRDRLAAGDTAGAREAWLAAREGWERSEVFTGGFAPGLDRDIDAWPNATTGFHAVEATLFGAAGPDGSHAAEALYRDLVRLGQDVRGVTLTSQGLLNGLARLAYELGESKIDGGESRVSGSSLNDMRHNVEGIEQAWRTLFADALDARDAALAAETRRLIDDLKTMLERQDLRGVDPQRLRATSEDLVLALQAAAPALGLERPALD